MHLGSTQLLVGRLLSGRHLDQRGTAQEHLGPLLDHHGVITHRRHVGAAGGRVSENQGNRRDPHPRHLGEIAEPLAAGDEHLGLVRQVGPSRLDQIDQRKPVLPGDVLGAQGLGEAVSIGGAGLAGGVVGGDHALHPGDDSDAGDRVGAEVLVGSPRGQGRKLEKRGVPIDQQLDSLPDQELASGSVTIDVLLAASQAGLSLEFFELGQLVEHRLSDWKRTPR